jgi:hypothetical protein
MSLRGFGRAGSDDGLSSGNQASLLNTPLANTMKKVGMNPSLAGNSLNQFLVKKGPGGNNATSNTNTFSN